MSDEYTDVELHRSRLTLPKLVDDDYETIKAERLADLKSRYEEKGIPWDVENIESDPSVIVERNDAHREHLDKQTMNDAVKAWSIDDAWGPFLDILGASVFCVRRQIGTDNNGDPIMEGDEEYRRRVKLAPETLSKTAPGNYEYWASTIHVDIKHARISSVDGPRLTISLLSRHGDGTPSAEAVEEQVEQSDEPPASTSAVLDALFSGYAEPGPLIDDE